jgi:hypothetical protein
MSEAEARQLLAQKIAGLRALSYDELRHFVPKPHRFLGGLIRFETVDSQEETIEGASGVAYDLEAEVIWDDKPEGDLRVIVICDDPDSGRELTDDFIMAPDGSFVGE